MSTVNLWPAEVIAQVELESPSLVLKQQAKLLGQMTKNLVEAHVEADNDSGNSGLFVDNFVIESSVISYRYELFSIRYPALLNPIDIFWVGYDGEIFAREDGHDVEIQGVKRVWSREEMEKELEHIFSSPDTVRIIQALIARARI